MSLSDQRAAYAVAEFCDSHGISKALLYKMWAAGKGPALIKVGRRTLISAAAAAEWRARMTERTPSESTR